MTKKTFTLLLGNLNQGVICNSLGHENLFTLTMRWRLIICFFCFAFFHGNDFKNVRSLQENIDNADPVQLRNSAAAAKPPIPPRSSSIVEPNGRSPMKQNGAGSTDMIDNQQYFVTAQQQRPMSVDRSK